LSSFSDLIPNPHLLIRLLVVREAVLSSRIEGTRASVTDVLREEAGQDTDADTVTRPSDSREVLNYVYALEHGRDALDEEGLSLELVKQMHEILLEGVRGEDKSRGQFRDNPVWLGPPEVPRKKARFVPPSPGSSPVAWWTCRPSSTTLRTCRPWFASR
jgi:Fic family protein